jgi:hypothetical protein
MSVNDSSRAPAADRHIPLHVEYAVAAAASHHVQPARQSFIPRGRQATGSIWQTAELLMFQVPMPVTAVPQLQAAAWTGDTASHASHLELH